MELMNMHKLFKVSLALSCFLPLYFIFGIRNLFEVISIKKIFSLMNEDDVSILTCNLQYNRVLVWVWFILICISIVGIICFMCSFLNSKKLAKATITLLKANNITADYYFTYFSLFVLSFFTIDPTEIHRYLDIIIFGVFLLLMVVVYIRNDMYFINPVLNILGYRSYLIAYKKGCTLSAENNADGINQFEVKVFSKDKLDHEIKQNHFLIISPYDFSICSRIGSKNNSE